MDINSLPDAWEMVNRLTGSDNDGLYDIYYKISVALFDYRAKHGLSQKELAKMLEVCRVTLAQLLQSVCSRSAAHARGRRPSLELWTSTWIGQRRVASS